MREYTLLCEDELAREVERLAREYGLTQEAVIRQLLSAGVEQLDRQR
jgi:predicted transcriptional regulator